MLGTPIITLYVLTFVLEERGEGIIGGWLIDVSKTPGLSRNPVDELDNTLETG